MCVIGPTGSLMKEGMTQHDLTSLPGEGYPKAWVLLIIIVVLTWLRMIIMLVCWFLWLTVQIALIFGARTLDYVFNLCEGKFDFLERLSDSLLLSIISYLDLEDIASLSQTSRRFSKVTVKNFPCAFSSCFFLKIQPLVYDLHFISANICWILTLRQAPSQVEKQQR